MTISLKHAKTSTVDDSGNTTLVQPSDWNDEHTLTQATNTVLGRTSAGSGATEELSAAALRTLINVESGADVTDATNVAAAGAIMESDYDANTILAATSDNTPVTLTVAEQTLVGRITAGNIDALTATEVRTLLNVEDGADVTDTTNVTAAGALMDSELANIAAVKALDQGVATTDSPTFVDIDLTTGVIAQTATNESVELWGGTADNGSGIKLYGDTHATQANDFEIYSQTSLTYSFDDSADAHYWYAAPGTQMMSLVHDNLVLGDGNADFIVHLFDNDKVLYLAGGGAFNQGANLQLKGGANALANDVLLRSGTDSVYFWDDSADAHYWYAAAGTARATLTATSLSLNHDNIIIQTSKTPASASATGTQGMIAWDTDYLYVCVATDTWKRVAIATW